MTISVSDTRTMDASTIRRGQPLAVHAAPVTGDALRLLEVVRDLAAKLTSRQLQGAVVLAVEGDPLRLSTRGALASWLKGNDLAPLVGDALHRRVPLGFVLAFVSTEHGVAFFAWPVRPPPGANIVILADARVCAAILGAALEGAA